MRAVTSASNLVTLRLESTDPVRLADFIEPPNLLKPKRLAYLLTEPSARNPSVSLVNRWNPFQLIRNPSSDVVVSTHRFSDLSNRVFWIYCATVSSEIDE